MSLDNIIDRHTTRLRAFSPGDWGIYDECDTPNPEIASLPWGDVILDGNGVVVFKVRNDADARELMEPVMFLAEFGSPAVARLVAEHIATLPDPTDTDLLQFLERNTA